jgi:hypothetical protein
MIVVALTVASARRHTTGVVAGSEGARVIADSARTALPGFSLTLVAAPDQRCYFVVATKGGGVGAGAEAGVGSGVGAGVGGMRWGVSGVAL